jgi:hypothetical protein
LEQEFKDQEDQGRREAAATLKRKKQQPKSSRPSPTDIAKYYDLEGEDVVEKVPPAPCPLPSAQPTPLMPAPPSAHDCLALLPMLTACAVDGHCPSAGGDLPAGDEASPVCSGSQAVRHRFPVLGRGGEGGRGEQEC